MDREGSGFTEQSSMEALRGRGDARNRPGAKAESGAGSQESRADGWHASPGARPCRPDASSSHELGRRAVSSGAAAAFAAFTISTPSSILFSPSTVAKTCPSCSRKTLFGGRCLYVR